MVRDGGFFEWHERLARGVSERSLGFTFLAKVIIVFSLGSIYSIELVQYGIFILISSAVILASYARMGYIAHLKGTPLPYSSHIAGLVGAFLLILFVGIQATFIPIKGYLILAGFVLLIPPTLEFIGGAKK